MERRAAIAAAAGVFANLLTTSSESKPNRIRRKDGTFEEIIEPEKLRQNYGINFIYVEPKETEPNFFELVPTKGVEVFIRMANLQLFKEYFGFLWEKNPPASLDIVIVKRKYLCSLDANREGSAYINNYAEWIYGKFETFIKVLRENKGLLRQTGLPRISLPNGEGASTLYIDFGGRDIDKTIYHLTKLQEAYSPKPLGEFPLSLRSRCIGFNTDGRAAGPMPEFVLDKEGKLLTDTEGKPQVRLHGRIYCAIEPEKVHDILNTSELIIHELSHEEVMFKEFPVIQSDQPDEHIIEDGHLFTKKSFEYFINARASESQRLFVFQTENFDEVASISPIPLLVGLTAARASKFFADRKTKPSDRAAFLSTTLGSFALMNLGVFNSKEHSGKAEFFSLF